MRGIGDAVIATDRAGTGRADESDRRRSDRWTFAGGGAASRSREFSASSTKDASTIESL